MFLWTIIISITLISLFKIVSFKSAQGNKTPEQNALIQQARRNPIIAKNMYESEMKKLKKQLNELLESYNKISRK